MKKHNNINHVPTLGPKSNDSRLEGMEGKLENRADDAAAWSYESLAQFLGHKRKCGILRLKHPGTSKGERFEMKSACSAIQLLAELLKRNNGGRLLFPKDSLNIVGYLLSVCPKNSKMMSRACGAKVLDLPQVSINGVCHVDLGAVNISKGEKKLRMMKLQMMKPTVLADNCAHLSLHVHAGEIMAF